MPRANHIKLMVDYNLIDPEIIEGLEKLGALDVKTTVDCGFAQNAKDPELIQGTTEKDRILLTADVNTIDERKYKPCTHGGIMFIDEKRLFPNEVVALVKAFVMCGQRGIAKKHVTHLTKNGAKIITHDKEPVIIDFNENPNLRKIVKGI